jgi:DNA-binding LacI/PurR family transcriptional regulator
MSAVTLALFALAASSLFILGIANQLRGPSRVRISSLAVLGGSMTGLGGALGVVIDLGWERGDVLNVVGLLLTVGITLAASRLVRGVRRLRIGIVIPSMRPFHRELRRGLRETLSPRRYVILDPYFEGDNPEEDLSAFGVTLQRALSGRADVLVICAPAVELVESPVLVDACTQFARRGGHTFFIESVPSDAMLRQLRSCTAVVSDFKRSAELQAGLVAATAHEQVEAGGTPEILVVAGPKHSKPAAGRLRVLSEHLSEYTLTVAQPITWTGRETEHVVQGCLSRSGGISIICCGNDDMARGACLACHRCGRADVAVIGHDGIYEAIVAIADPFSPLIGTVRIPPKAFGHRVATLIPAVPGTVARAIPVIGRRLYGDREPDWVTLPMSRSNVVTCHNAPHLLHGQ